MLPAIFEHIQPLDPEHPLEALSLPGWLTCCVNNLGADYLHPEIPSELALSEEQRASVAARLDQLTLSEIACDVDHTMAVVVDLLEAFPSAKLAADQARSKARGYMDALEGVPTWAVFEARRRWLQARAGSQNYDFAPSPPRLREVANDALSEVRGQRSTLQRLLRARSRCTWQTGHQAEPGQTEEERAIIGGKLIDFSKSMRAKERDERAALIERRYQATGGLKPLGPAVSSALATALAQKDELDVMGDGPAVERAADDG